MNRPVPTFMATDVLTAFLYLVKWCDEVTYSTVGGKSPTVIAFFHSFSDFCNWVDQFNGTYLKYHYEKDSLHRVTVYVSVPEFFVSIIPNKWRVSNRRG